MRIGIVGYGYWGPNLVRNFMEAEGCTVGVCCDQSEDRLARARRKHPGLPTTTDYGVVLADRSIDAIAIATPVRSHYGLAKRALEAGKHVLLEKPLTEKVEQAEELVALAQAKGLVLMVDHVFVYSPPVRKTKDILDSGKLGKLFYLDSIRINLGLFQHDVNVVWDLAPHDLSIADYLLQRLPKSLTAFGSAHTQSGLEDVAYLNLDFGDGLIANFHVNWLSPVKVRHMILAGSEHSLIYNDLDPGEKIKVYDRGIDWKEDPERRREVLVSYRSGDVWCPNLPNAEPLAAMAAHFAACIQESRRPLTDGEAGLRVVRILDAAQRSIKTRGERVLL